MQIKHLTKRRKLYLPITVAFIILTVIISVLFNSGLKGNAVVASVEGQPITLDELKNSIVKNRALVYGYFKNEYSADDSKDFLTTSFNGEVPVEKLKKVALDDCIKMKAELILAKEKGLIKDISYQKFLQELKLENNKRKKAVKDGTVIYGPQNYGEQEYYSVFISGISGSLNEKYKKDSNFSYDEIKKYYNENKDKLFKKPDIIKIAKISVSYITQDVSLKTDAEKLIQTARQNIEKGMGIEELQKDKRFKVEEILLDSKGAYSYSMLNPELISKSLELKAGEISEVIDEKGAYNFAICLERKSQGVAALEDVKNMIIKNLSQEAYNTALQQKLKSLKVIINNKVYCRISGADITRQ